MATSTIDTETVRRQIRVAKLVMAARYFDFRGSWIAEQETARGQLVAYIRTVDPAFRDPSAETWRLVVAHLSVVDAVHKIHLDEPIPGVAS
jgi:hypothetical protein